MKTSWLPKLGAEFLGTAWLAFGGCGSAARSTAPALFVGGWALAQLWLFWVAPLVDAALAGAAHRGLAHEDR